MSKREFTLANEHHYDRSSPARWVLAHILRYPLLPLGLLLGGVLANVLMSYSRVLVGHAFTWVGQAQPQLTDLAWIAVAIGLTRLGQAVLGLSRSACGELLAQYLERDCRDELYLSLLGKSLTYHARQRVGDLMSRATNDVRQVNLLASPGLSMIFDAVMAVIVPIVVIATLRLELALVPLLFAVLLVVTLRDYLLRLGPVSEEMRRQFGTISAGLAEAISGIEVVKANAQEEQEQDKFARNVNQVRGLFLTQAAIQARYWPFLVYAVCFGVALLHALWVFTRGDGFGVGELVSFVGLVSSLRFPTFTSIFTFSQVQMGLAGARRILTVLNTETELDENPTGAQQPLRGEVIFDHVTFGYDGGASALRDITFRAAPGETIAIVGQTGSGKTTLTRLINRVYDVTAGRVLLDGIDARAWSLESLRSQISTIEQDVFLFSRPIHENIAFGVGQQATRKEIEHVAREADAHTFITAFPQGYETAVGERGVTLSGGQRQRLAIARAFLTNPRILILDDSTSAIDSATEDEIQRAMYRVRQGRTTFLITHRLSQIRWADRILVLRRGELVDQGTHEELMARCEAYRHIFSQYDAAPTEGEQDTAKGQNTETQRGGEGRR